MKLNIFLTAILSIILFSGCKKDKSNTINTPEYLKQMLPYQNGQNIRFQSGTGAIVEAIVSIESRFSSQSACPSCESSSVESIAYLFKVGTSPFVNISIDNRPNIFMTIFSPTVNFQTGGGFDFLTETGVPKPVCTGPRQICLPSVVLNGITYNNVLEISNGSDPDKLTKAYYTVSKGLLGFAYGSGLTYTLL